MHNIKYINLITGEVVSIRVPAPKQATVGSSCTRKHLDKEMAAKEFVRRNLSASQKALITTGRSAGFPAKLLEATQNKQIYWLSHPQKV